MFMDEKPSTMIPSSDYTTSSHLVLSLFPGIGLLDHAFELEGFTVVRGPDVLWGGDVRQFHVFAGRFDGVIGGPPCKAHSSLVHIVRARYGESAVAEDLIPEFERVVGEAQPAWFLMENTPLAPLPVVSGYGITSLLFNNRWAPEAPYQNRERRFSFGVLGSQRTLRPEMCTFENPVFEYAVIGQRGGAGAGLKYDRGNTTRPATTLERKAAASRRTFEEACLLQGLPADFLKDAPFTSGGKWEVVGNGVPIPMGRAMARAVREAVS
jgi:DNA (cytosine-5)-methyltransferase 1